MLRGIDDLCPPKVRELIAELERNGFVNRGGEGVTEINFIRCVLKVVTVSGQKGDDAQRYR